jgi:[ribosomal protein S5]-alanine N-acetyltransferase
MDTPDQFETDRLALLRPRLSHAGALLLIFADRDAMRYTLTFKDIHECRRHIAGHECQRRRNGYGPWTVVERSSERIIGFGGIYDDPFDPGWGMEVGYHFHRSAWGHGYATELVGFCLRMARRKHGARELQGFVHPDNAASRRVLERSGFQQQQFVTELNRYRYLHRPG